MTGPRWEVISLIENKIGAFQPRILTDDHGSERFRSSYQLAGSNCKMDFDADLRHIVNICTKLT